MIICAAVKIKFVNSKNEIEKLIICGLRHSDCFRTIRCLDNKHTLWSEEGFINHEGKFLDRKEALKHAQECGQLSATHRYYQEDHNIYELYSEDLY